MQTKEQKRASNRRYAEQHGRKPRPRTPCRDCGGEKPAGPGRRWCDACLTERRLRKMVPAQPRAKRTVEDMSLEELIRTQGQDLRVSGSPFRDEWGDGVDYWSDPTTEALGL